MTLFQSYCYYRGMYQQLLEIYSCSHSPKVLSSIERIRTTMLKYYLASKRQARMSARSHQCKM